MKMRVASGGIRHSVLQGWGRLQRHDYDYDYTMITETDYDYNYGQKS